MFETKWLEQFLNHPMLSPMHVWKPLSTRGCNTKTEMWQSWGVVSLIPRRWMQVMWVYTAIKAITSFPVQELGAREWTLQLFGFQFFLNSCQTLFTKAFVSSVGDLQKHNPALASHTSVAPCSLQIQSFPLAWKHLSRIRSFPPWLACWSARFSFLTPQWLCEKGTGFQ